MPNFSQVFSAGFFISWSGRYFNAQELIRHYIDFPHESLAPKVAQERHLLGQIMPQARVEVTQAQRLAEQLRVVTMPIPEFPEAYFSWHRMTQAGILEKLGEEQPLGIAFLVGFHSGGVMAAMRMISTILNLSAAVVGVPAFEPQWQHASKDIARHLKQLEILSNRVALSLKTPASLREDWALLLLELGQEIADADIDFSNDAYLILLSSKIRQSLNDFQQKYSMLASTLDNQ